MGNSIAEALGLKFEPVAILWRDEPQDGEIQFVRNHWGCVMWMFSQALKGKTVVFDRQTFGCNGGGVGLGFGNQYLKAPGGVEALSYLLSTGIESCEDPGRFSELLGSLGEPGQRGAFAEGERLLKAPDLAKKFVEGLPMVDVPAEYVLFKPLSKLGNRDEPVVVVFAGNPHQISALVSLANYSGARDEGVVVPWGAGCHQIGIYAYREAQSEAPRAVLGLTDITARRNLQEEIGKDMFTFAVPYKMFREMEEDVKGSFLEGPTWKGMIE